jgi:acyl-CoA thioester hydrolase
VGRVVGVSPEFRKVIRAVSADVDELGHVSNVAYLRWVQDAAKSHSEAVGWDFSAYQRLGAVFVVRRHELDYLAPSYEGEDIELCTWIEWWKAATSERKTRIVRVGDGRELARASTLWALVTTDAGRPTRITPELRTAFSGPFT